jgi:hypothetical protein
MKCSSFIGFAGVVAGGALRGPLSAGRKRDAVDWRGRRGGHLTAISAGRAEKVLFDAAATGAAVNPVKAGR